MKPSIVIAKDSQDMPRHIDEVDKSAGDRYVCIECGAVLIPIKSKPRKKSWHFRHKVETACSGGYDDALHRLVVRILADASSLVLPRIGLVNYANPRTEQRVGESIYRSDLLVTCMGMGLHFEVVVTHDLSEEKRVYYQLGEIGCVRIEVRDFLRENWRIEDLRRWVLHQPLSKSVIYWPGDPVALAQYTGPQLADGSDDLFAGIRNWLAKLPKGAVALLALLIFLVVVVILRPLFPPPRKNRR